MKITIVGGPFLPMPPAPTGAIERVWHGLAEEFARRDHTVTVLCRAHADQSNDETVNGVRYVRRLRFRSGRNLVVNLIKDFAYAVRLATLLPPADIVVTNTFWLPVVLRLYGRRKGRIAVHVGRIPKGQLLLYGHVDRLQAVSEAVRAEIERQRPALSDKTRVFPYPIDSTVFAAPAMPRGARAEPVVLYAGRINPEKGIHLLIAAAGRLCGDGHALRVRIVGPWRVEQGGAPDYRDELKRLAAGLPVEFAEPVFGRQELAKVYHEADIFCYPSLAEKGETFGVAPLEAMATGLPTVVSGLACFRDFLTDGATGLVFDHRAADPVDELAAKLGQLLDAPAERLEMGTRAAARAAEFSYPAVADRYLADFARMMEARA